jgi:YD repeat-containing protein
VGREPGDCRRPFLARRLSVEESYRRRVEVAERLGVAPSRLDGREVTSVTEYEYDDAGRLTRAVTTHEREWTEQDRGELLALALYRSWLCPDGCGFLAEHTLSHEESGPAFAVSHTACRATLALIEAQRAADPDDRPNPNARARLWTIQKRR